MNLPDNIKTKLRELPAKPGCYIMRNRYGRIIYVGKAASLRQRVRSYFHKATLHSADAKLRGLIKSIADFDIIVVHSEADAVLTESRLIKDYRPRYNSLLKDDKRFPLLSADLNQPFPRFKLCRFQRPDDALYFGPYTNSRAARVTLEFIGKRFGLRKCFPLVPGPADHKHCINDIVRFCAAPCVGKVTPAEYRDRVNEACAFLRGERPAILNEVETVMNEAAQSLNFEKAAAWRDTLHGLRTAIRERARVARTPVSRRADGLTGVQALHDVLRLSHLPRLIEAYDISSISGTLAVGSLVAAVDGIPHPDRYRHFRIKTPNVKDDAGMMAEIIRRRFSRLKQERGTPPDLVLVDGGAIQLQAARNELEALGFDALPAIGLAKRLEEIYAPSLQKINGGTPWNGDQRVQVLRLPSDSPALKIFQALRDEAHRFALTYHRRLRARRIRESVLDDIPGIGANRKQMLLKQFGSVSRLAQAPESELAALPGIGKKMARTIKQALTK
ncbi:MAG: excinuclease ABC subunit UvrC [Verrucomicrobia bacterium]|nr:excinuclease ABC subunit UvrC [Verrucomicrobiota bacterium]MBU4291670.1 excinuclease ABC subunit UvrC [Verrucomicrobiota bacterium]MBU4429305.1 excinuclease ABC subunit UvrC [Verrucomicrobiota bacterium]MCG2680400.1 excinuclease ABC subunit UvrC [Kiritimatiellia bacterium]